MNKTIKNWKWWVALPFIVPVILVVMIPMALIVILEFTIAIIQVVNIVDRPNKLAKKLVEWVHK